MIGDLLVKNFSRSRAEEVNYFGYFRCLNSITLGILIVDLGTDEAEFLPHESAGVRLPFYIYLGCTVENTYATIKLQVLPNLLTPASQGKKKGVPFYF
jgi:hypothetical protein